MDPDCFQHTHITTVCVLQTVNIFYYHQYKYAHNMYVLKFFVHLKNKLIIGIKDQENNFRQ